MLDEFRGLADRSNEPDENLFVQAIDMRLDSEAAVKREDLIRYDDNIGIISRDLGLTEDAGKTWKSFQYLALLFTERYLDLYFSDKENLLAALNQWKTDKYKDINHYTPNDIRTLAFQSATGSGKTLLLHANILQYKHYLETNRQLHKLNKVILVTPDEGLSRQHLRELQTSGIPAQLFSDDQGAEIFSRGGVMVDIIDLHKLDDKKGIKRVALDSFEENNLVMVDEGHLGTGGKVWRRRRKQLAKNGFTFEYSATFNQVTGGTGTDKKKFRDEYGKAILFDYSYKFFYEDGYGKDYQISNLQHTDDTEANNFYLLACLLMFYQQCRIYKDKGGGWREFNLAPPLWVFLGRTVTAGNSATQSDVVRIVKFLAWVQSNRQEVLSGIARLLSGDTGLLAEDDTDIFSESFSYLGELKPRQVYDDLLTIIFHAKGQLHISHLTGFDELQLCVGDARPFAVINVGDASGLYGKLEAVESPLFSLSKNAFARPLFAEVDNVNSPITIVIGSRKFAAGWNSWRVSTMGLMHVGAKEGPQIIQMFGRGVRLKGRDMSLKRHTAIAGATRDDSAQLKLLETLNIFGLKANYMNKFKEYLQDEGIKVERVTFSLPIKKKFGASDGLKILQKHRAAGEFNYSKERVCLSPKRNMKSPIKLDCRKHLQVLESVQHHAGGDASGGAQKLEKWHLDLMNKKTIYQKVLARKRRFAWHNMEISREAVDDLLAKQDWYELYISPEKMQPSHYGRVREWENLAVDLISEYADEYWRWERRKWEHEHMNLVPLDNENPNYFGVYTISIDAKQKELIQNIELLLENIESGKYQDVASQNIGNLSVMTPGFHAYVPLFYVNNRASAVPVSITPIALNKGEADFVNYLKDVVENIKPDFLRDKKIYLMRNLTRGKGVSFFNDYSFHPDFILWIAGVGRQDILFIDPKGLVHYNKTVAKKVALHRDIKKTERKVCAKHPGISLHSYIWSVTDFQDIGTDERMNKEDCHKKGIYLASGKSRELCKLLEHALK